MYFRFKICFIKKYCLVNLTYNTTEKLKICRCRESNFLSTIIVLSLPPPKFLLSPRKSCDKLISESVDVEDDDSGGVLEELLFLR